MIDRIKNVVMNLPFIMKETIFYIMGGEVNSEFSYKDYNKSSKSKTVKQTDYGKMVYKNKGGEE